MITEKYTCDNCMELASLKEAGWAWIEMRHPKDTHFCSNKCAAEYFAERAGGGFVEREAKA